VWDLLGAVPEQELLQLVQAMSSAEPVALLEATRNLLDRGRDPGAVLQGLAGILRDLVLMAAAPDRPELTGVSPQFREQLPPLAKALGRARLLQWQAQLRGSEQQLRQSVQPRLWLEVLLLGLLAEATTTTQAAATSASVAAAMPAQTAPAITPTPVVPAPLPTPSASPAQAPELPPVTPTSPESSAPNLAELWQQILGSLELPSTRMLLSQQGQLVRLDANKAVVQVASNWMGMVQSRAALLEQAMAKALGGSRQLVLEASSGGAPPMVQPPPAPVVTPPVITTPEPVPEAQTTAVAPELPNTQPEPVAPKPSPAPSESSSQQSHSSGLDRQARNLADFFNGQVLDIDDIN